MRVKILSEKNKFDLEYSINKWLEENQSEYNIIDIKYIGTVSSTPYALDEYSVMIIYRLR